MQPPSVLSSESALEYFRAALVQAIDAERLRLDPFTQFYVVDLLSSRTLRGAIVPGATLADRYCHALNAPQPDRARLLRDVGDTALVSCGLWCALDEDTDYRIAMGSRAYGRLADLREPPGAFASEVYAELAYRFPGLVEALMRIGAAQSLCTARDVLYLYERWCASGSRHFARELVRRGFVLSRPDSAAPS